MCESPPALPVEPRDERQQPEQHLLTLADRMKAPVPEGVGGPTEGEASQEALNTFVDRQREDDVAGGTDNGAPGVRAIYHPDYYGGYVLDPDGNNIEAVCHQPG
jgi:hypothetical protein